MYCGINPDGCPKKVACATTCGYLVVRETAGETTALPSDPVSYPKHYTSHPSGIECIQITEHFSFNIGNVIKYVWRVDDKYEDPKLQLQDLKKARWYLDREISKREAVK